MNILEVRKAVGNITGQLFKNSNTFSIGMLKSHFRGTGLKFKEHQVYTHGDDVRFIDWKLLAKTGTPYIKTFEEDRNVEIVAVIDAGPSMLSGYDGVSKLQASIEICCLLYLLAKETGDYIHALILADEVINIPKMAGEKGIVRLVSTLEEKKILNIDGRVNIARIENKILSERDRESSIMKHLTKMREVVLLSDFHEFIELKNLKRIIHRKNVHCFQLLSPLDETTSLPFSFFSAGSNGGEKKGKLGSINFKGIKEIELALGKKVKKLNVKERYLETFVKEML